MRIAIDGPAGAGKSTVARQVATRLGYLYIDTGAMYRALTYKVLINGANPHNEDEVYAILTDLSIRLVPVTGCNYSCRVFIADQDVTLEIREPRVSESVSAVAKHPKVREAMVHLQQQLASSGDVVMDGRDIGTTVMPTADLKIFLQASVEERAKRRILELQRLGHEVDLDTLIQQIKDRDLQDSTRKVSPLRKAEDAIEVDTTMLSITEVVDIILTLVSRRETRV